jgi:chromosome segregation ATPase
MANAHQIANFLQQCESKLTTEYTALQRQMEDDKKETKRLEAVANDSIKEIAALDHAIQETRLETKTFSEKADEMETRLLRANRMKDELQMCLQIQGDTICSLQEMKQRHEEEICEMERIEVEKAEQHASKLADIKSRTKLLKLEMETSKQRRQQEKCHLSEDQSKLKVRLDEAKTKLKAKKKTKAKLASKIQLAKQANCQTDANIKNAEEDICTKQNAISSHEAIKLTNQNLLDSLLTKVARLDMEKQGRQHQNQKFHDETKSAVAKVEELEGNRTELNKRIAEMEKKVEDNTTECNTVKANIEDKLATSLPQEYVKLETNLNSNKFAVDQIKGQLGHDFDVELLKKGVDQCFKKNEELKANLLRTTKELEQIKITEKSIDDNQPIPNPCEINQEVHRLKSGILELNEKIQSKEQLVKTKNDENKILEAQKELLKERVAHADQLTATHDKHIRKRDQLAKEFQELSNSIKTVNDDIKAKDEAFENYKIENTTTMQDLNKENKDQLAQMDVQIKEEEKRCHDAKTAIEKYEKMVKTLEALEKQVDVVVDKTPPPQKRRTRRVLVTPDGKPHSQASSSVKRSAKAGNRFGSDEEDEIML